MSFLYQFGNLFGWLTVIFFAATVLNYVIKFINKKWGKKLSASPAIKSLLSFFMKLFVKNHKIWGFLAFFSLMIHFIIQFLKFGLSISGLLAAGLLILQVLLGMYAVSTKRPRKGTWFLLHRCIALALILGVAFHVLLPFGIQKNSSFKAPSASSITKSTTSSSQTSNTSTTSTAATSTSTATSAAATKVFTLDELKTYNGQNGQPSYVAYNGVVYDVSNVSQWKSGKHHGETAGTDVTNDMSKSPHGESVLANVPVVGTLK